MPYTNKTTIKHKRQMIDISTMSNKDLKELRTQMFLDLADIENQVAWKLSDYETDKTPYDRKWMKKATTAAKIKRDDIDKIDELLKSIPESMSKEEYDLRELLIVINEYMDGVLSPIVLDELLERLNREYPQ